MPGTCSLSFSAATRKASRSSRRWRRHRQQGENALDRALALEPKHADAHIAIGLYHAEIIDKVGALAGRLTYGADAGAAVKHFEQALKLNPGSAIAHMEYANGLLMLHGEKKHKQAVELYRKAAACKPADAMERLDVEQAKAELE